MHLIAQSSGSVVVSLAALITRVCVSQCCEIVLGGVVVLLWLSLSLTGRQRKHQQQQGESLS